MPRWPCGQLCVLLKPPSQAPCCVFTWPFLCRCGDSQLSTVSSCRTSAGPQPWDLIYLGSPPEMVFSPGF